MRGDYKGRGKIVGADGNLPQRPSGSSVKSRLGIVRAAARTILPRHLTNVFVTVILCVSLFFITIAQAQDPETRQRPGEEPRPIKFPPYIYESVPDIESSASGFVSIPDRWRQFYVGKWYDPYNQNVLKGDIPVFGHAGHEWFLNIGVTSDTLFERTKIALPVVSSSSSEVGRNNQIGNGMLSIFQQNFITSFSLIRGDTTFKPPEYEFRVTPVFNVNYAQTRESGILNLDPGDGLSRDDDYVGFLELFADVHLLNISHRYDFISSRIGIQEFQSDFRGFVFTDSSPGVRLFGNFDNNRWQANLAWFSRLLKDTNSGINTFDARHEDVFVANVYRQDALVLGHQIEASIIYRQDLGGEHGSIYDSNGFLRRPAPFGDQREKNIYTTYLGLAGDGHFGRINTTTAFNYVFGSESHNNIAARGTEISAAMFAQEISYDMDWIRFRASFMWASGDKDPFDNDANGFDAINDNPNFAGGDLSYWQREGLPFIAGGGVFLVNRNSLLPDLRSSKEEGQSNYVNPGLRLFNLGVDFELTPKLKLITNGTFLQFDQVATIAALRQDGSIDRDIGFDLSAGLLYRPFLNNNVQFRLGTAALLPGNGIKNIYGDNALYHGFTNVILQY